MTLTFDNLQMTFTSDYLHMILIFDYLFDDFTYSQQT